MERWDVLTHSFENRPFVSNNYLNVLVENLMNCIPSNMFVDLNDTAFSDRFFAYLASKIGSTVKAIDLSSNEISSLESIAKLGHSKKFPNLQGLHLKHNLISSLQGLENFAKLNLIELSFIGNPVTAQPNYTTYVWQMSLWWYNSEVERIIPSLQTLDSKQIAQLSFPVQKVTFNLPKCQPSFADNNPSLPVAPIVQDFIQQ